MTARAQADPGAARTRLLEAATALVARDGIEGINSNQVARAAGVGVGTFYKHFPDKHALHRAVVMNALAQLQERVAAAAAASAASGLEAQVRATVAAAVDFAAEQPECCRVAFAAAPGGGRGRAGAGLSTRPLEHRLGELARAGEIDAAIDPAIAARAWAGMQGAVLLGWLDERPACPRERVIETLVRLHPALAPPRPAGR